MVVRNEPKYTKAEIQFWWNENDNSIHVTAMNAKDGVPLATTFPANQQSDRWHRSMFTWLAKKLAAEGKAVPDIPEIAKFQQQVKS